MRLLSRARQEFALRRDAVDYFRTLGVQIGADCRLISPRLGLFGSEPYLIKLGNNVTVTGNVQFITHDGGVCVLRHKYPDLDVIGKITVGDNVFIGFGAIVMPGVTIGRDSVVAAGAVVAQDVAEGSIVGGVPAKQIKTVDQYEREALERGLHVRSLPADEKRVAFLEHVGTTRSPVRTISPTPDRTKFRERAGRPRAGLGRDDVARR